MSNENAAPRNHVPNGEIQEREDATKNARKPLVQLQMDNKGIISCPSGYGRRRNPNITGLTHECGVFGAIACGDWPTNIDIAHIICLGLVGLQHRGQESAGIVTSEGDSKKDFNVHKGMGMISTLFNEENIRKLRGNLGIGHTRYSTSAASEIINCQPFVVHTTHGPMALAHNGELVNSDSLRRRILEQGVGLSTHSDSELIAQTLCSCPAEESETDGPNWPARIRRFMKMAHLSYSLVIMLKDRIYAVRDVYGNRPLCLGKILPLNSKVTTGAPVGSYRHSEELSKQPPEGWVVSSESCVFLSIGARLEREVEPGEIIEITREGHRTVDNVTISDSIPRPLAFCIFEYVYFSRGDSIIEGQMVYTARLECGRQLAREAPACADIVSSVPESGTAAAHGYARETGMLYCEVLCRNRYVGRTFIQPSPRLRRLGVAKKFGALSANVVGKRVVLIDDSIVRGNTIGPIIRLLREAGATEVHIRIASPPLRFPCFMGINIPTQEELIANRLPIPDLTRYVGADSLAYLSVDGLLKAVNMNRKTTNDQPKSTKKVHCTACLTGEYPESVPKELQW